MALNINIIWDEKAKINFQQTLLLVGQQTRRSLVSLISSTSVFYVQSAKNLTPQSSKRRRHIAVPKYGDRSARGKVGYTRQVLYWDKTHKRQRWAFFKDRSDADKFAVIRNRGLYKALWLYMLPKQKKVFSDSNIDAFARRSSKVYKFFKGENPFVKLTLLRPEVRKMRPGIVPHALHKAKNRMLGYLRDIVSKELHAAWKHRKKTQARPL